MKFTLFLLFTFTFHTFAVSQKGDLVHIPFSDWCENAGSYSKEWLKGDRYRVGTLEERRKSIAAMTQEQRERVSDFEMFPNFFQTCGMGFHEGVAKVRQSGKVGFIDPSAKIVIPLKFIDATRFSEGLAGVEFDNGKWGFIDLSGKLVVEARYDWAVRFNEGRALVQIGDKWGFIDKAGKLVVPAKYEHAWSFSDGLAAVQVRGIDPVTKDEDVLVTGYVDRSGRLIIKHQFGVNGSFFDGKALISKSVKHPEKGGYYTACFWIDKTGKIISDELDSCSTIPSYESTSSEIEVILDHDYRVGYQRSDGKIVWKPSR